MIFLLILRYIMIYIVATMFIHKTTRKVGDKTYHSFLLSESYRENGKVKHRVISNLSRLPKHLIEVISLALKNQRKTSVKDLKLK